MNLIQQIEAEEIAKATTAIPEFRPGDTVRVGVKVISLFPGRHMSADVRGKLSALREEEVIRGTASLGDCLSRTVAVLSQDTASDPVL